MDTKVYVANLAWSVTNETLKSFFEQAGAVTEAQIILDRETGRSRGFGFVTMETPEGAQKAIQSLDGVHLNGRPLMVRQAKPEGSGSNNRLSTQIAEPVSQYIERAREGESFGFGVGLKHFTIVRDDKGETANVG